jgi:hypothetical protein
MGIGFFPIEHGGVYLTVLTGLQDVDLSAEVHNALPLSSLLVLHAIGFWRGERDAGRVQIIDVPAHDEGFPWSEGVGVGFLNRVAR